jgi:osmotically-inducible protein OsmY
LSIDVDTSGNVVTLNGTVESNEQRERAVAIARGVEGATEVRNNLTVKQ